MKIVYLFSGAIYYDKACLRVKDQLLMSLKILLFKDILFFSKKLSCEIMNFQGAIVTKLFTPVIYELVQQARVLSLSKLSSQV
jgi:hypothetical protein